MCELTAEKLFRWLKGITYNRIRKAAPDPEAAFNI
jgi:hypothetical protein